MCSRYRLWSSNERSCSIIRKLTQALDPKDRVKVENNLERGYVLPVAVVFIVGDRRIALSVESAQYALYNPKFPDFLGIMMPANTEFDQIYSAYIDIIYT